jgi:hypothetical protein
MTSTSLYILLILCFSLTGEQRERVISKGIMNDHSLEYAEYDEEQHCGECGERLGIRRACAAAKRTVLADTTDYSDAARGIWSVVDDGVQSAGGSIGGQSDGGGGGGVGNGGRVEDGGRVG